MDFKWDTIKLNLLISVVYIIVFGLPLLLLFFFVASLINVPEIPERMSPARIVNDYAEIFSDVQQQQLENTLVAFEKATSTTIVVVTVDDLDEYTPNDYAMQIFYEWGMGQQGDDNGIVLLLKPRNEYGDAKFFFLHCDILILDEEASEMFNSKFTLYEQDENYYAAVLEVTNIVQDASPLSTTKYYYRRGGGDIGRGGDAGGAGGGDSGGGGELF